MLKFVFAPDSFKESLSANRVCEILDEAAKAVFPDVETAFCPVADGGEGTLEAVLCAVGGENHFVRAHDPIGRAIDAAYGLYPGGVTAVIEMAKVSGLPLVSANVRDPLKANSLGLGELMRSALHRGARRLLIGIGGSATNDGGMGMLSALGVRFYGASGELLEPCGQSLGRVERIELNDLLPEVMEADIQVLCDVTNPLLGSTGATRVYGAQKGATGETQDALEAGMENYARRMREALGRAFGLSPGAGAAGGVGAALADVLGAKMTPGIDAVLDAVRFDEILDGADLVVTGEGRMDAQSVAFGKAPAGVAKRAAARGIPVIAFVGGLGEGYEALYDLADASAHSIVNAPMPLERAMRDAERLAKDAANRMFRMIRIGMKLREGG